MKTLIPARVPLLPPPPYVVVIGCCTHKLCRTHIRFAVHSQRYAPILKATHTHTDKIPLNTRNSFIKTCIHPSYNCNYEPDLDLLILTDTFTSSDSSSHLNRDFDRPHSPCRHLCFGICKRAPDGLNCSYPLLLLSTRSLLIPNRMCVCIMYQILCMHYDLNPIRMCVYTYICYMHLEVSEN